MKVIGRGPAINRAAGNPLDVWVLPGDVVLPLPLNSLTTWDDAAPGPLARLVARGVVLTSPSDAGSAYGDLFPTPEAAKKALQRDREAEDIPGAHPYRPPPPDLPPDPPSPSPPSPPAPEADPMPEAAAPGRRHAPAAGVRRPAPLRLRDEAGERDWH